MKSEQHWKGQYLAGYPHVIWGHLHNKSKDSSFEFVFYGLAVKSKTHQSSYRARKTCDYRGLSVPTLPQEHETLTSLLRKRACMKLLRASGNQALALVNGFVIG